MRVGPQAVSATLARAWPRGAALAVAQRAPLAFSGSGDHGAVHPTQPPSQQPTHQSTQQPALAPALECALREIEPVLRDLASEASIEGARLRVTLSDALVHLDVIAGDFIGNSDRQLQAIAEACAAELLGEGASDGMGPHEVRWQLQPGGEHLLVCAVPRACLAELARAAGACGLKLASVQPDFVCQWNAHAGALKPGATVFAVAASAHVAVAAVINGVISAISVGASAGAAAPRDALAWLDARVDRLLTGIGQDLAAQSAFVLVSPDGAVPEPAGRWVVRGQPGATE